MNGHEHHHHDHDHRHDAPETRDAGSQALAEALGSSFTIVKIVMGLMVVAFICSGFFQVGPQEKAVILRFGKPLGEGEKVLLGPGLHWSFPYPIDEVVRIPITEIQTVTSDNGWYFTTPEQELTGDDSATGAQDLNPAIDGSVLTADRNIIHTRATLSYHITDPIQYIFNFVSASNAVQNALDNALLYSAAQFKADDVLINDVAHFQETVQQRVSDLVEQDNLGITIDQCTVQSAPPRQLAEEFAAVTRARDTRAEELSKALNDANQATNNASATADNIINLAQSAKARYVDSINAEARRFNDILPKYELNPNLYVQQTFVQMIGPALTNVQDKWFLPVHADSRPYDLRLELNREPIQPPAGANPYP